jgi:hypothetical protein
MSMEMELLNLNGPAGQGRSGTETGVSRVRFQNRKGVAENSICASLHVATPTPIWCARTRRAAAPSPDAASSARRPRSAATSPSATPGP